MARRLSAGQHQLQVLSVGLCFLVLAVAPMANAAESQLGAWPFRTDEVVILYGYEGGSTPCSLAQALRNAGAYVIEYSLTPQPDDDAFITLRQLIHHNDLDEGGVVFLLDAEDALADADWQEFFSYLLAAELVPRQIALIPLSSKSAILHTWLEAHLDA